MGVCVEVTSSLLTHTLINGVDYLSTKHHCGYLCTVFVCSYVCPNACDNIGPAVNVLYRGLLVLASKHSCRSAMYVLLQRLILKHTSKNNVDVVPHSQTTIDTVPYIQSTPPPALFTPPDKTLFCCLENSLGGELLIYICLSACFVLIHCIVLHGAICPSVRLHMVHLNNNDMI